MHLIHYIEFRYRFIAKIRITAVIALRWFAFGSMLRDAGLYEVRREHVSDQIHQRVDGGNILRGFGRFRSGAADSGLDRNDEDHT